MTTPEDGWNDGVSHDGLPSFNKPPVTETVLSIQFAPLPELSGVVMGLFWQAFRERIPISSELPALNPVFETFGGVPQFGARMDLTTLFGPPPTRFLFEERENAYLLQIQRDRIIFNWRKRSNYAVYPRYGDIRGRFQAWLDKFQIFLTDNNLGSIVPNQGEVTYLNAIDLPTGANPHRHLEQITPLWSASSYDAAMGDIENASASIRRILEVNGQKVGRVYANFTPVFVPPEMIKKVQLEITVRGKPVGATVEDALAFLDLAHEAVIRNFAAVTTPDLHRLWDRTDG